MSEIPGPNVLLLGFGREGQSSYRFLRERFSELKIAISDQRLVDAPDAGVRILSGDDYLSSLGDFQTIVRSPGISLTSAEVQDAISKGIHLTTATNLFFSEAPGTKIAVTGTKGKSTTSALIAHLLSAGKPDVRLIGNIGEPMLDNIAGANEQTIFVIECSSFQLEDFHYSPDIAVFLNVVEEHLDRHGTYEAYFAAKLNLLKSQNATNTVVCNPAWEAVAEAIQHTAAKPCFYGNQRGTNVRCFFENGALYLLEDQKPSKVCNIEQLKIRGPGNIENAMAACVVAASCGLSAAAIAERLESFQGLPHRLEYIGCFHEIEFYNDSLSTIPEATINAISALGEKVRTLILGGQERGLNYDELATALVESSVEHLILFPSTGERIWQACQQLDGSKRLRAHPVESMQKAVELCFSLSRADDICLLSPASSSLNMFRDYRERGEQFANFIKNHR